MDSGSEMADLARARDDIEARLDNLGQRVQTWRFVTDVQRQRRDRATVHRLARKNWRVVLMSPPSDYPIH